MKKLFVAALLVVGITAFAQEREARKGKERLTTEQKVDLQVKKMSTDLNLNDKQKEQIKSLVTKQVEKREQKRKELQESKKQDRAQMKAQMEANQAATSAEMKKILTPEQFTKWEKLREEKKDKMKERMMERKEKKELK